MNVRIVTRDPVRKCGRPYVLVYVPGQRTGGEKCRHSATWAKRMRPPVASTATAAAAVVAVVTLLALGRRRRRRGHAERVPRAIVLIGPACAGT